MDIIFVLPNENNNDPLDGDGDIVLYSQQFADAFKYAITAKHQHQQLYEEHTKKQLFDEKGESLETFHLSSSIGIKSKNYTVWSYRWKH